MSLLELVSLPVNQCIQLDVPCAQMVGMRACYLFSRLVKALRQNLRPLLPDVLLRLQPHLAHILAHPVDETAPSAKGVQGALPP